MSVDSMVVDMIVKEVEEGLNNNKNYIFALNAPRLKESINLRLQNKGYKFKIEDNTGVNGEYSKVQVKYIVECI